MRYHDTPVATSPSKTNLSEEIMATKRRNYSVVTTLPADRSSLSVFPRLSWFYQCNYSYSQLQGILYTTPALLRGGSASLTLVSCCQNVETVVNAVVTSILLRIVFRSSHNPATYGRHIQYFFPSCSLFLCLCEKIRWWHICVIAEINIRNFLDHLNSLWPTIQFTMSWRMTNIFFSQTHLWQEGRMAGLTLKWKLTHTDQNRHYTCHPSQHVKRGVASCLLSCVRTVPKGENVLEDVKHAEEVLKAKGYPVHIIMSVQR